MKRRKAEQTTKPTSASSSSTVTASADEGQTDHEQKHKADSKNKAAKASKASKSAIDAKHDGNGEFEVERIVEEKTSGGKHKQLKYLVKWLGYDKPTWEPAEALVGCSEILAEWQQAKLDAQPENEDHHRPHSVLLLCCIVLFIVLIGRLIETRSASATFFARHGGQRL